MQGRRGLRRVPAEGAGTSCVLLPAGKYKATSPFWQFVLVFETLRNDSLSRSCTCVRLRGLSQGEVGGDSQHCGGRGQPGCAGLPSPSPSPALGAGRPGAQPGAACLSSHGDRSGHDSGFQPQTEKRVRGALGAVAPREAPRFCCGSASIRAVPGQPPTCPAQTTPCSDAGPWKGPTELCFLVSTAPVWLHHRNGERVCAAWRGPFPWRLSLQLPLEKLL